MDDPRRPPSALAYLSEGPTRLAATPSGTTGPGAAGETPFYNPAMALNRDLTVRTVAAEAARRGRDLEVLDALCGAGARALRIAHEVPGTTVHANDTRPDALEAVQRGAEANGVSDRVVLHRGDAAKVLAARRFDVVDIDPYGPPTPFLDAALRATRPQGLLCITSTDTAALCGVYPRVARRRYGVAHDLHGAPWRAEVGLRILLSACVRAAGRAERGIEPVWSVAQGHWMRVVVRVRDGATAADKAWRQLQWAAPDDRGTGAWHGHEPSGRRAGPLWSGALHDRSFLDRMVGTSEGPVIPGGGAATGDRVGRLLDVLDDEAREAVPAFWVDLDTYAGRQGRSTPRTVRAIDALQAQGHVAARTHMSSKGVRTDAPREVLDGLLGPT